MPQKKLTEIWYEMWGFDQKTFERRAEEEQARQESARRIVATTIGILLILAYGMAALWIADLETKIGNSFNWPLILGILLTVGIALMPIPAYRFVYRKSHN